MIQHQPSQPPGEQQPKGFLLTSTRSSSLLLGQWHTRGSNCTVDGWGSCCHVICCPWTPIGRHADLVGWNCCLTATAFAVLYSPTYMVNLILGIPAPALSCCIHAPLRRKIREKYGIEESFPNEDCLCTFCCPLCAICQEAHEVLVHSDWKSMTAFC